MTEPVAWDLAERVAVRVGGHDPLEQSYLYRTLEPDFSELTEEAEALVSLETGFTSPAGPARARVTDRAGWIHANVKSFQRLLRPLTKKLEAALEQPTNIGPVPIPIARVGRSVAGTQVGLLLGWMSTRVLGQYDQLIIEDENPDEQDMVYYVGPNVIALEKRFAFPPREFRLWLALHEVTHRMQFTAIPWMRPYFLSLVEGTVSGVEPDPRRFVEALKRAAEQMRQGHNPLEDGGLVTLLAGPEQYEGIQQIGGLMSLLEGHGDVTMDRAGADRIPSAERFSRVLRMRRQQKGPMKVVTTLIGLDAKLKQYQQGEDFIRMVEASEGRDFLAKAWEGPEWLPDLAEIRQPPSWIARIKRGEPREPPPAAAAAAAGATPAAAG